MKENTGCFIDCCTECEQRIKGDDFCYHNRPCEMCPDYQEFYCLTGQPIDRAIQEHITKEEIAIHFMTRD